MSRLKFLFAASVVAIIGSGISTAGAATIYQDTFTNAPGNLNGRAVEVGSANWIAATTEATVGGGTAITGANRGAFLPFNPVSGNLYTYSVVATASNPGDVWGAIGFSNAPGVNNEGSGNWLTANNSAAWWLHRPIEASPSGQTVAFKNGTGSSADGPTITTTPHTYTIVLNTADSTSSLWTVEYKIDGVTYRGPETFGFEPNIQYAGWGSNGAINTIDTYSLSDVTAEVPEPTAVAVLALASVGMLSRRKR